MLSPEYMAGFFDGEGCVLLYIQHGALRIRVIIENTNHGIISDFHQEWGGNLQKPKMRNPQARQTYRWNLQGDKTITFLEAIKDFVIVKKPIIELAIAANTMKKFAKLTPELIASFVEMAHSLNKKGVSNEDIK